MGKITSDIVVCHIISFRISRTEKNQSSKEIFVLKYQPIGNTKCTLCFVGANCDEREREAKNGTSNYLVTIQERKENT